MQRRKLVTGPELKRLRKKLRLSSTKAARQVEVSARTWTRWEAGGKPIPEGVVKLFKIVNRIEQI